MTDGRIGYAVSDCRDDEANLGEILGYLGDLQALELQPEKGSWDIEGARSMIRSARFLSVHAPSYGLDLSSEDEHIGDKSVAMTIDSMDLAHGIGAKALVLHPVNEYMDPAPRHSRAEKFLQRFREILAPHHHKNSHEYALCLENLEFGKYPASFDELDWLYSEASSSYPVMVVLDVPHVWNTRRILLTEPDLAAGAGTHHHIQKPLPDYVAKFIEMNGERVSHYHVANFGEDPIRTHDPLTDGMHPDLKSIMPMLADRPVILEIYNGSLDEMKRSAKEARRIMSGS